jgi:DNA-directed RNA polymerase specialized sigma24 family protein
VGLSADEVAELYDRHAEAILAFLVRRTWDPEVAVDVLAETFAVAIEGRHRFRGRAREAAGAWATSWPTISGESGRSDVLSRVLGLSAAR